MPELPEVELTKRNLDAWVRGRTIREASAQSGTPLRNLTPKQLADGLRGKRVDMIERHGKQLLIKLSPGDSMLLAHLGMTGKFLHLPPGVANDDPKRFRMLWALDDGLQVGFRDPRRFGRVRLLPEKKARAHPEVKKLGPDAYRLLSEEDGAGLKRVLGKTKSPIKLALMDQGLLAGIGNIYASEGLYRARVSPRRKANKVSAPEAKRLAEGILAAMDQSLALEAGDEVRYVEEGGVNHFKVYDREGETCPRCKKKIRRLTQGGRSTFYCPGCQAR